MYSAIIAHQSSALTLGPDSECGTASRGFRPDDDLVLLGSDANETYGNKSNLSSLSSSKDGVSLVARVVGRVGGGGGRLQVRAGRFT